MAEHVGDRLVIAVKPEREVGARARNAVQTLEEMVIVSHVRPQGVVVQL